MKADDIVIALRMHAPGTSRAGAMTVDELQKSLNLSEDTVWKLLAVLVLQGRVRVRGILKKRVLVTLVEGTKYV